MSGIMNLYKALTTLALFLMGSAGLWAQTDPFPDINPNDFYGNMSMSVVVTDGEDILKHDVVVAAYCGKSLRGKGMPQDNNNPGVIYLTVYGNATDEKIYFKVYTQGNIIEATPEDLSFTNNDVVGSPKKPYAINIGKPSDNRILLDENSTTPPDAATGVDVRVKRTIKANQWSTICLPFAMTEEQVKTAFGDDVELAGFTGCKTTTDEYDNINKIEVNFKTASTIEANHPYVIKVSSAVNEFTADNVDISIDQEEVSVECDEFEYTYIVDKITYTGFLYNRFVGTYVANTVVPDECLFLSDNKFYYSTGKTKMKGYRAYFEFYDVLAIAEESAAKIRLVIIEEEAMGINDLQGEEIQKAKSGWYTIGGRKLKEKPTVKGIYIAGGKKVAIH